MQPRFFHHLHVLVLVIRGDDCVSLQHFNMGWGLMPGRLCRCVQILKYKAKKV